MTKLNSYREVGFFKPKLNKYMRLGWNPSYWFYRLRWFMVEKVHYITRFPIHIDIESTNVCNMKCTMCPHSLSDFEMMKGYFDFHLFKKIMAECREFNLCSLKLNIRGEPLLHRRLTDMVAIAKENGIIEVMFNTNGLLLTPEKTRELFEAGLDYLIVSIDGATATTYNKIRQGGNFHQLVENLEYFIRYRKEKKLLKPLLRLQFVEMEENSHEVKKYLTMWQGKVDVMTVNRYSNRGCGEKQVFNMQPIGRTNCPHPWRRLSIFWNGNSQMCCGDWRNLCVLGNVGTTSIYDIWHSEKLNEYRRILIDSRLNDIICCKECFALVSYIWKRNNMVRN
ncbi:MAG: radical SAM protein [Desulfobacterales bacterium]|nr:radical SAM protein [Desulfobacterales bacterium]